MTSSESLNSADSESEMAGVRGASLGGECPGPSRRAFVARTLTASATLIATGATSRSVAAELEGQPGWHFCSECFGLFYAGDPQGRMGRCPKGGGHKKYGFNFVLPFNKPESANHQANWHYCRNCFGMFYAGDKRGIRGVCPYGGSHVEYGFNFLLEYDIPIEPAGTQANWRFCNKCFGMFYAGDPRAYWGVCPAGIYGDHEHEAYGFNFDLPHTAEFYTPQLPTAPPVPPNIRVDYKGEGNFVVHGTNFLGNHEIQVRVAVAYTVTNPTVYTTHSNGDGTFDYPVNGLSRGFNYAFSASDGRTWSSIIVVSAS
jgi:hypothetical protein